VELKMVTSVPQAPAQGCRQTQVLVGQLQGLVLVELKMVTSVPQAPAQGCRQTQVLVGQLQGLVLVELEGLMVERLVEVARAQRDADSGAVTVVM